MITLKEGFDPNQPRDDHGQWTNGGGSPQNPDQVVSDIDQVFSIFADLDSVPFAQRITSIGGEQESDTPQTVGATVTYSNAFTGDERIDKTTDRLTNTLKAVMDTFDFIPSYTPRLYGTAVHSAFGAAVLAQGVDNVQIEFSVKDGKDAVYGSEGSVRVDVALRSVAGEVIAIYDLKTGGAVVSSSRANELRDHFNANGYVPVIELHINRGSRIKNATFNPNFRSNPETDSRINSLW